MIAHQSQLDPIEHPQDLQVLIGPPIISTISIFPLRNSTSLTTDIMPANKRGKPTGKPLSAIKQQLVLETLTANDSLPTKERMLTSQMAEDLGISERQLIRMRGNLRRYGFVIKPVVRSAVAYQEPENMPDPVRKYLKGLYCGNCGRKCTAAKRKSERVVPLAKDVEVKLAGFTETQLKGLLILAAQNSDWVERLVSEAHRTVFAGPRDQDLHDLPADEGERTDGDGDHDMDETLGEETMIAGFNEADREADAQLLAALNGSGGGYASLPPLTH